MIEFLMESFAKNANRDAVIHEGEVYSYTSLAAAVHTWRQALEETGGCRNRVVALEADFSLDSIAALLALVQLRAIIVPLSDSVESQKADFRAISQVEDIVRIGPDGEWRYEDTGVTANHELLRKLATEEHPGLILFSFSKRV